MNVEDAYISHCCNRCGMPSDEKPRHGVESVGIPPGEEKDVRSWFGHVWGKKLRKAIKKTVVGCFVFAGGIDFSGNF